MVSKPILDPDVRVCYVWPRMGCLSIWPCNYMRHNEDLVSVWESVCHIPHRIGEKLSGIILI